MYLWEYFINFILFFLFQILIHFKLNNRPILHSFILKSITLCSFSGILLLINILDIPTVYGTLIFVVLAFLYSLIFYSASLYSHVFWTITYTFISLISEFLNVMIPTRFLHIPITALLLGGSLRIAITFIYVLFTTLFVIILLCFPTKSFLLSTTEKLTLVFLSILCITIEESIIVSQTIVSIDSFFSKFLYIIFSLIMILYISLIICIYNLGIQRKKNNELIELQIISKLEQAQYEQMVESTSEIRFLKHEINNHLETIKSLNTQSKTAEIDSYIQSLIESNSKSDFIISSGNIVLDSIFSYKLMMCKNNHIQVNYTVHYSNLCPLCDMELCSIIGNLFDNAIEACIKLPEANRLISFIIKPYKQMLSITVTNSSDGKYTFKEGILISSKDDTLFHGLGLKRIQNITESHQGFIDMKTELDHFKITIMLPLSLNQEEIIYES